MVSNICGVGGNMVSLGRFVGWLNAGIVPAVSFDGSAFFLCPRSHLHFTPFVFVYPAVKCCGYIIVYLLMHSLCLGLNTRS